jgi:hypothetical protein
MYPIADGSSSFEAMGGRFEKADPGFQVPLEIFDGRWNAGVNASRGFGEKRLEPTISGLTEFADESAEHFSPHYWQHMGVGVHCLRDGRVSQALLGYLRVDTLREHERRAGVLQVVEADRAESGLEQQRLEASLAYGGGMHGRTD